MGVGDQGGGRRIEEKRERKEVRLFVAAHSAHFASPPLHTPIHAHIHINVHTCKVQMHAVKYT